MKNTKKLIVVLALLVLCTAVFAQSYGYQKITKSDIQTYVSYMEDPTSAAAITVLTTMSSDKIAVLGAGFYYVFSEEVVSAMYGADTIAMYSMMGIDLVATTKAQYASLMDPRDVETFDKNKDIILKSKVLREIYLDSYN
ncbi:MAG: hypothetical protein MJ183_10420 [Treponemataceae bacterium]|nr:hypothetical protein [Treponemataceae bacterium]